MANNNQEKLVVKEIEPTLFVGLGGTGGEVVARVKRKFELYFATASPQEREKAGLIQYLVADTAEYNLLSQTARSVLDRDDFVYLGGFNGQELNNLIKIDPDLQHWWDPRYSAPERAINCGANTVRMLGRGCLFRSATDPQGIRTRIRQKLSKISAIEKARADVMRPCQIYIVTGSGGGTGSGIFWDTAFLLWEQARAEFAGQPPKITAFILLPFLHAKIQELENPRNARRVLANAYALFEELELLLDHPDAINDLCMTAISRKMQGVERVPNWRPFEECYLIDYRIEGVGNFQRLEDIYSYMAKAIFHLYLTPYEAQLRAALAGVYDTLRNGRDAIRHKCTAYSSLGFSSIEYPRELILSYLYARYTYDILQHGFLRTETKMADIARKRVEGDPEKGEIGWADRLGRQQLHRLSEALDAEVRKRTEDRLKVSDFYERDMQGNPQQGRYDFNKLSDLGYQIQEVRERIERSKPRLKEIYDRYANDYYDEIRSQIHNLIDNCTEGLRFAREVLLQTDNLLTEELKGIRSRINELEKAMAQANAVIDADENTPGSRKNIEQAASRNDKRTLRRNLPIFVSIVNELLENGIRLEAERLKEMFLRRVTGEPEGGTVAAVTTEGIITGYVIELSILDQARADLEKVIKEVEGLRDRADEAKRLDKYFAIAGRELTTYYLPQISKAEDLAQNPEVRGIYSSKVPTHHKEGEEIPDQGSIKKEMQEILQHWRQDNTLNPKLHEVDKPLEVAKVLERILYDRAHNHFDAITRQSVWKMLKQGKSDEDLRREIAELEAKATPACPIDRSRLAPLDQERITMFWSAGCEQPDELIQYLPEQARNVATARLPQEQVSILKTVHGFPFYAVRFFNDMRVQYNLLGKDPNSCLHLHQKWNPAHLAEVENVQQSTLLVTDEALLYFSLGLFFDSLLNKRLPTYDADTAQVMENLSKVVDSLFYRDPKIPESERVKPRGLVYYDGRQKEYRALNLELVRRGGKAYFNIRESVSLGSSQLHKALEAYNDKTACIQSAREFVEAFLAELEDMGEAGMTQEAPVFGGMTEQEPPQGKYMLGVALELMKKKVEAALPKAESTEERDALRDIYARLETFIEERKLRPEAEPLL